jgi:hypothetical protein
VTARQTVTTTYKVEGPSLTLADLRELVRLSSELPETALVSVTRYAGDAREPGQTTLSVSGTERA